MRRAEDRILGSITYERFFWEFDRQVPFLGRTVHFMIDPEQKDGEVTDKQRQVYLSILKVPESTRRLMAPAMYQNYRRIRDSVDDDTMPSIANATFVWRHVSPSQVFIPRHSTSRHEYFFVAFECAWEPEHGLEVLFKNGAIEHVSQQNGLALNERWFTSYINE